MRTEINKKTKLISKILEDKTARQMIVRNSFDWFFSIYFHNYIKYETASFQREIFQIIEDDKVELAVIVAFRGSAKSTIVSTASVLWSILGKPQKKFVIILSQTDQKARQHLQNIKMELENNEVLRKDLGPFDEEKNQWGSTALIIKKFNAKIMISSSEQSIRGMRFMENRPDLIIIDDIEDINSVKTQDGRDKISNWFMGEVLPARGKKSKVIIVGNLLHEDSLLKRLQEKIESGKVNGVYKEYPILNEDGNPMWLGKYPTLADIEQEKIKTIDDVAWAREYLLKILPTCDQVVEPDWIHRYDELPLLKDNYEFTMTGVDPAFGETNRNDYTAMVSARVYSIKGERYIYILPNPVNERLKSPEMRDRIMLIYNSAYRGMGVVVVEDVGGQKMILQELEAKGVNAIPFHPGGSDKRTRLSMTAGEIKSGFILFPRTGAEQLIGQIVNFGSEKHDDLTDAFTTLILGLRSYFVPFVGFA